MEDYPLTQREFEEWFASEEACEEYLCRVRWPEGFRCVRCGGAEAWRMKRGLYRCGQCDAQTSATAGTIFQDSRKGLRQWFRVMWFLTDQAGGLSAVALQSVLGLGSYHTAWTWLHKLRRAMVRPGQDRLAGEVEVDEGYLGGPDGRGNGADSLAGTLVFVAVAKQGKRVGAVRLCRVPDASPSSLQAGVRRSVEVGSLVRSDDAPGYRGLSPLGYRHMAVRAKMAPTGRDLLPAVGRVMAQLRRRLLTVHRGAVRPSHLDFYLDEFTFRFNHRRVRPHGRLFRLLLEQAVTTGPIAGEDIEGDHRRGLAEAAAGDKSKVHRIPIPPTIGRRGHIL